MKHILISLLFVLLVGCNSNSNTPSGKNICQLFLKNPDWYWAAKKSQQRWGVPISLMLAIIYQESHFRQNALPKRAKLFRSIPWFRVTTARGFAQATNATWHVYCRNRGRISADRENFRDAVDFVGWYISYAHQKLHVAKNNSYIDYLVYHEGTNGYARKSYRHKYWLKHVARKVHKQAQHYHEQLIHCIYRLPKPPWWYSITH